MACQTRNEAEERHITGKLSYMGNRDIYMINIILFLTVNLGK